MAWNPDIENSLKTGCNFYGKMSNDSISLLQQRVKPDFVERIVATTMEWTKKDYKDIGISVALTLLFAIRGGEMPAALIMTMRYLFAYYFYGLIMVLIFVGLTKKMFKYEAEKKKMILWMFYLAAFFAVSQFIHEGFLMITGQELPK